MFLFDGPEDADATVLRAHGAGAPMDSPAMAAAARALAETGLRVARFEFAYMAQRRDGGNKRPPPKVDVLAQEYAAMIAAVTARKADRQRLVIGGKSLGGRMASMVADEMGAAGLICLGYPFHPPGKPERTRPAHLAGIRTPTLIVQGTSDPFGNREDVAGYALSTAIQVRWIEGGNHDLQVPGRAKAETWSETVEAVGAFGRG